MIPSAANERKVWLRVGTLLDGVSTRAQRDAHLVYDAREILFVGYDDCPPPARLLKPEQRRPDLDLPEWTLLPGLIEAHAHLFLEGGELNPEKRNAGLKQSPAALLAAARSRLERLVRFGVVAVRDAGDKDGVGLALSKLYCSRRGEEADSAASTNEVRLLTSAATSSVMPYIDSPGAAIHHQGRYGSFMAEPIENFRSPRECVEARVNAGADRIKLIPTGIINFKQGAVTSEPQMTTREVREFVAAAAAFGRQTFAHASGDAGIEHAIEGRVDSVEHGFFVRDDQLARMRDRQIAWVPTFVPVQKQIEHAGLMGWDDEVVANLRRILDRHAASLVKAHALGVQIIAGSDAGSYGVAHGIGLLAELELMERAGLSPLSVINAATGTGSRRLGFKEQFGKIEAGHRSRFLLTRHSPLESVSALKREKWIVFDDLVFESRDDLDTTGL